MVETGPDRYVQDVRRFNRFYTQRIGVLREGLADSPFSLSEGRVVYELAHRKNASAAELARDLDLDEGYLSRLLQRLVQRGIVSRKPSPADGRRSHISLTPRGAQAFAGLNQRTNEEIAAMLASLPQSARQRLTSAMHVIEAVLDDKSPAQPYVVRRHAPGDMGWVVRQHGALYHQEYGWDITFEALVAEIVAKFVNQFDPRFERCWIAELDGRNVGSVFCVRESDRVAKLRLLIVRPEARGLGIGHRLVADCIQFARDTGYKTLGLWTNDILTAARRIYQQAGFRLIAEEPHRSFCADLVGQNWELEL